MVYSVPILNEYEEYVFTFHLSTLILIISMKNHIIPCWTASRTVKYECCHCHILHFSFHFLQIVHNVTLSPYHYKAVFITFCTKGTGAPSIGFRKPDDYLSAASTQPHSLQTLRCCCVFSGCSPARGFHLPWLS